jgi:nitrate reductase cytochrome c-type subunit
MTRYCWKKAGALGVAVILVLFSGATLAEEPAAKSKRLPRAYEGAPPLVPHDVEARKGLCQECHTTGEQGAPITPHPTRTHFCVQCHVGQDLAVKAFPTGRAR